MTTDAASSGAADPPSPPSPLSPPSGARALGWLDVVDTYRASAFKQCVPVTVGGQKKLFPRGVSGFDQRPVTDEQIKRWVKVWGEDEMRRAAVGLVLPRMVIGIDVDAYDGRNGAESLAQAVADLGPLPPTASIRARDDGSGIWLFKVSTLVADVSAWPSGLGVDSHVDLIKWCHRYVVAPPGLHHATGRPRQWFAGEVPQPWPWVPSGADIAWLPPSWVTSFHRDAQRGTLSPHHHLSPGTSGEPMSMAVAAKVLSGPCMKLANAQEGNRNNLLHWAARVVSDYFSAGLDPQVAEESLLEAAVSCGLSEQEAVASIRSAFKRSPRDRFGD